MLKRFVLWRDGHGVDWVQSLDPQSLSHELIGVRYPGTEDCMLMSKEMVTAASHALGRRTTLRGAAHRTVVRHFQQVRDQITQTYFTSYGYRRQEVDVEAAMAVHPEAFCRAEDLAGLAVLLVGEENVRADVIKAVGSVSIHWLMAATLLWDKTMPVDWFVHFLRQERALLELTTQWASEPAHRARTYRLATRYQDPFNVTSLRTCWLTDLDRTSRARLLKRTMTVKDAQHIRDITGVTSSWRGAYDRARAELGPVRSVRTWAELEEEVNALCARHEQIRQQQDQAARHKSQLEHAAWLSTPAGGAWLEAQEAATREAAREAAAAAKRHQGQLAQQHEAWAVRHTALSQALTAPVSTLRYEIASTRAQLNQWSTQMCNCIRGYSPNPTSGSVLVAVYQNAEMIANMEIRLEDGSIAQLTGRRNARLEPTLTALVRTDVDAHQALMDR